MFSEAWARYSRPSFTYAPTVVSASLEIPSAGCSRFCFTSWISAAHAGTRGFFPRRRLLPGAYVNKLEMDISAQSTPILPESSQ